MGSFRKPAHTSILVLTSFIFQQIIPVALLWAPSTFADTTAPAVPSPFSQLGSTFNAVGNPGITANFNSCMSTGDTFGASGGQVQQIVNASKVTINPDGSTSTKATTNPDGSINTSGGAAGGKNGKGGAAAAGANGPGCGNPVIPSDSSFSCTTPRFNPGGTFDPNAIDTYISQMIGDSNPAPKSSMLGELSCKKGQLDSASAEVSCIAKQGQLLAQQIGSLSSVFQANITRFQQDDQTYKQRIGDRTSQISQIGALLNGDGGGTDANGNPIAGTGKKGLLQIAASLKTLTETTLPAAVAAAQNTAQTFANTGNTITQNVQYRTMSLIGNCFKNQPVNGQGYNCVPNGPNVSAEQFLECRYEQYAHVQNGTYDIRSSTNQQAQSAQTNLDAIFQQMFNNTPMSWTLPTDQSGSQAASTASYTATSLADAETQYTSQLSGITVNGVNLATEANQLLQVCQAQAVSAVANEQTSPSSYLGQSIEALYQQGTTNNANFSSTIQQNANAWTDAMTTLSQQNLPLNLVGCQPNYNSCVGQCAGTNTITMTSVPSVSCVSTCGQTSSAQQVSCLTQLNTQINGLYQGSGSQPAFTMNVTSQFPDTALPASALQCKGILGCIAQLQATSSQISTIKTQLTTADTSYINQARTSTAQFATQLSQLLSTQSSALRSKMDSLNTQLRSLGIQQLTASPIQSSPLTYDQGANGQPGLPQMPTNMLGLIGGGMSPPMPDVTDPNFANPDGFQDAENKVQAQQTTVADLESTLQGLESTCGLSATKNTIEQNLSTIISNCVNVSCPNAGGVQQIVQAALDASQVAGSSVSATDTKAYKAEVMQALDGTSCSGQTQNSINIAAIESQTSSCSYLFQGGGGSPADRKSSATAGGNGVTPAAGAAQ
jgi:hypothetical protein